jgi:hypothetical protein
MRSVVFGIIFCLVLNASAAFGLTATESLSAGRGASLPQAKSTTSRRTKISDTNSTPPKGRLFVEPPAQERDEGSSTSRALKALASGDSTVNPWFPGRGAIGVQLNLSW